MKYVSFIRHAALMPPFDNYDHASLALLEDLARQLVMPPIDHARATVSEEMNEMLQLANAQAILHATSLRAQQTADVVAAQGMPVHRQPTPLLNELRFSPFALVTNDEYEREGMQIIRDRLFATTVRGTAGTEEAGQVYDRIAQLEAMLVAQPQAHIVCVTHGFLMRYLQLYFVDEVRDPATITPELLARQVNYPNLTGFRITLP